MSGGKVGVADPLFADPPVVTPPGDRIKIYDQFVSFRQYH
jgi:hypothetical protein